MERSVPCPRRLTPVNWRTLPQEPSLRHPWGTGCQSGQKDCQEHQNTGGFEGRNGRGIGEEVTASGLEADQFNSLQQKTLNRSDQCKLTSNSIYYEYIDERQRGEALCPEIHKCMDGEPDRCRLEQSTHPMSYSGSKTILRNNFRTEWRQRLDIGAEEDNIHQLGRAAEVTIFWLRTGHCQVLFHLHRLKMSYLE